ncbi:hypothetical protein TIFTF001_028405 [Ficus carica]|uniref:Uncharacterized protein n=1 Tax=Ficus carica TaxID=3494 RepID=A0AA88DPW9_FICCA|nr:hypothetical protein TIFTF001_028405 [Ficus carica]
MDQAASPTSPGRSSLSTQFLVVRLQAILLVAGEVMPARQGGSHAENSSKWWIGEIEAPDGEVRRLSDLDPRMPEEEVRAQPVEDLVPYQLDNEHPERMFKSQLITRIPRSENIEADALARLASRNDMEEFNVQKDTVPTQLLWFPDHGVRSQNRAPTIIGSVQPGPNIYPCRHPNSCGFQTTELGPKTGHRLESEVPDQDPTSALVDTPTPVVPRPRSPKTGHRSELEMPDQDPTSALADTPTPEVPRSRSQAPRPGTDQDLKCLSRLYKLPPSISLLTRIGVGSISD